MPYTNQEAATLGKETITFSISQNKQKYLASLGQSQISLARSSIQEFVVKRVMNMGFLVLLTMMLFGKRKNPIKAIRDNDKTHRVMLYFRDYEVWLGDLPYDYARPKEIADFLSK